MFMTAPLRVAWFAVFLGLMAGPPAQATESDWQQRLAERLPLLGHRNWIVVADAAYPLQSREGIETLATGEEQIAVLKHVLESLTKTKHVRPRIYVDAELPFVPEQNAKGVTAYRDQLATLLEKHPQRSLAHEEIIGKLDASARTFHVLILKTNLRLPYTSVFIELDCGYWSPEAEQRLRSQMEE